MKLTLSWLKAHLDTAADLGAIAERLTALGLEVEAVEDRGAELRAFTVGEVVAAEPHPDADKLRVCVVETSAGRVQVVCGAPNARAGMKGVFAPAGSYIPGTRMHLKAGVIRGVQSNGMLCSEREMGLSDEHTGIIELDPDAPVGAPFAVVTGLDDPLIEIGLTPQRGDCAGVRGIARDLAAAGLGRLEPLDEQPVAGQFNSPVRVAIDPAALDGGACPLFVGRYFRGLRNGVSPPWLRERLLSVGLRPISTLVDVTNFFTMDRARPLHVFDAARLRGDLVVRLSRPGESLEALDGETYTLDDQVTVIADDSGAVALGGLMGGEPTGVGAETTDVFLEVALFDPYRTAETGRKLGIDSDARYRFERGVDPAAVIAGAEQATRLILELCGGEASDLVVAGAVPDWRRSIPLRPARVEALGGLAMATDRQVAVLTALGCTVDEAEDGRLGVEPPSWRNDLNGEADLVEEVLRLEGYDAIPSVPLPRPAAVTRPALDGRQRATELVRRRLAGRGLDEAVTWSFMDGDKARAFGFADERLRIVNPIASDLGVMRPSILPNLIAAAGRNAARGLPRAALFEIGPAYADAGEAGQGLVAAGVRLDASGPRHWAQPPRAVDAFDAKADALATLAAAGAPIDNLQITTDAPDWYHPGRSGCLRLGANVLAAFGEVHPGVLQVLDVDGPVVGFEAFLDRVPAPRRKPGTARPALRLSPFQPVARDFAFIVEESVPADRVVRAARAGDKALIADVGVFDVYRGAGMPEGKKSVAVTVTLQPTEATLTDAQIEAVSQRIVDSVSRQTGGALRG